MTTPPPAACSEHKGHRRYVGGTMDGCVQHLVYADPSDYPQIMGTHLRDGRRFWYELDYDASEGTEAVYQFIGIGEDFPVRAIEEGQS